VRPSATEGTPVAVWDLPTRLFHWALVLLIAAAWWTAEEEMHEWHERTGLAVLGLIVFRLVWGVIGSSTARFSSFVMGPRGIVGYLRGRTANVLGHNPLGALSVLALLAVVSVQVGLGLFASDEDGLLSGPLSHWISDDAAEEVTDLHADLFDWLLILIGVHVAAILFYLAVKRDNLIAPMLHGRRNAPPGTAPMEGAPLWRFAVAAAIAVAVVWIVGS
jgi:cytochrome b